jgi:hypothetical protein
MCLYKDNKFLLLSFKIFVTVKPRCVQAAITFINKATIPHSVQFFIFILRFSVYFAINTMVNNIFSNGIKVIIEQAE